MHNNAKLWSAAIVASSLILLIMGITITAIVKYDTVDEALKFWSALGSVAGVLTGSIVTYFFKHGEVTDAEKKAANAQAKEIEVKQKHQQLLNASSTAISKLIDELPLDRLKKGDVDTALKDFKAQAYTQ